MPVGPVTVWVVVCACDVHTLDGKGAGRGRGAPAPAGCPRAATRLGITLEIILGV